MNTKTKSGGGLSFGAAQAIDFEFNGQAEDETKKRSCNICIWHGRLYDSMMPNVHFSGQVAA